MRRRDFLRNGSIAAAGLSLSCANDSGEIDTPARPDGPCVISTWDFGVAANRRAWETLQQGGTALDAAEQGVRVTEADPEISSVGLGGLANSEGIVELDASIMDGNRLEAGSVASLQNILHPVSVARLVMTETPHLLLVGDGARRFALQHGFEEQELVTEHSRRAWEELRDRKLSDVTNHDTIGMIVLDGESNMAGACTTSGLSYKLPGRVGDSPLIGHGMYCDSSCGGAAATGVGEEVIKVCGSYQVVEFMRQGIEPNEAIRRVLGRMIQRDPANREKLMAFVALRADGTIGYGSTVPGFQVAVSREDRHELLDGPVLI